LPGGLYPRGSFGRGHLAGRIFVRGAFVRGVFCPGGLLPGGLMPVPPPPKFNTRLSVPSIVIIITIIISVNLYSALSF